MGVAVNRGVAQFGYGPCFYLAYPLSGQVEVGADLVKRAGLTSVETEAQLHDLALARVKNEKHYGHLVG